jgi:hypothetical protein
MVYLPSAPGLGMSCPVATRTVARATMIGNVLMLACRVLCSLAGLVISVDDLHHVTVNLEGDCEASQSDS